MLPTLTVFTPAYNRAHTLPRTYQSLCRQTCHDFEWLVIDDGSTDNTRALVAQWIADGRIPIKYIYKDNGGLHTGYNTAYANIDTELCVCIDSDDWMPDNAVELILTHWRKYGSDKYAGITGLDFFPSGEPIGGYFPDELTECHIIDFYLKKIHGGDTKQVLRTELMRSVAPMQGFPGEKNFNPIYLILQVDDKYPSLILNRNLCFVEYQQGDSMSAGIFRQYINSPHSFAKQRRLEMSLSHNTRRNLIRVAIHYNSSCIIAGEKDWLKTSPRKMLTLLTRPLGWALSKYIIFKARQ
ncbi:MAG: glycosyltransferase family A protein [Muribaculaceae bacterium]